jgi:hypothetical protein
VTRNNDNARSGTNTNETILTPSKVKSYKFGKLPLTFHVDDLVYAQVLYVEESNANVAFVATMNNSVYAFNVDTGADYWPGFYKNYNAAGPPPTTSCDNFFTNGNIGILSTPVIDSAGRMFFVTTSRPATKRPTSSENWTPRPARILAASPSLGRGSIQSNKASALRWRCMGTRSTSRSDRIATRRLTKAG